MSQGGAVLLPGALMDDRPVPGSYLGSFTVAVLLAAVLRVGREYLRGKENRHWSMRFPVVGLENLNPKHGLTLIYQGAFLGAFVILPMASLVHFSDKVIGHADVANRDTRAVFDDQVFYVEDLGDVLSIHNYGNRYCMGQDLNPTHLCKQTDDYQGGVTWFPLVSPTAMLLANAFANLYGLVFLFGVLRKPRK